MVEPTKKIREYGQGTHGMKFLPTALFKKAESMTFSSVLIAKIYIALLMLNRNILAAYHETFPPKKVQVKSILRSWTLKWMRLCIENVI